MKNTNPFAAIYQAIDAKTFEELGYTFDENIESGFTVTKTIELDDLNKSVVVLQARHPIFTLLSTSFTLGRHIGSKDNYYALLNYSKRELVKKFSHPERLQQGELIANMMGEYKPKKLFITPQEKVLLGKWNEYFKHIFTIIDCEDRISDFEDLPNEEFESNEVVQKLIARSDKATNDAIALLKSYVKKLDESNLIIEGDPVNGYNFIPKDKGE